MATRTLTQDRLKQLLRYDPNTGIFVWRIALSCVAAETSAGTQDPKGYVRISVDRRIYAAHRLAWLYAHGAWPVAEIDHINRIRNDNRIGNLREADRSLNCHNSALRADNVSGHRGVGWHKHQQKWRARISIAGRMHELGYFLDKESAVAAYRKAAKGAPQ